jgi:thiamine biosynthesis lipoprotein
MDRVRPDEAVLTDAQAAEAIRFRFRAMAAEHELLLWARDRALAERAAADAIADVRRIEAKYTRYRDDSLTAAINRAAGRAAVAIDDETAALLRYGDHCYRLSGGLFDLTSGVLGRVWDFRRRPPRVPADDEIAAARARIGWERVEWSERTIRLPSAGMELDFGGIGKEYAADRAAAICRDRGVAHGLVNLGGDVRAIGAHPDSTPWRVAIRHPRRQGAVIGTVEVVDGAVATSGDYERFFEADGRRYCHLLDPRSGRPVSHWQSASVAAPLAILAGTYATIAMLLEAQAKAFLDEHAPVHLLVASDGTMIAGTDRARAAPPAS